jgi:AmiR/NasT family two-component response regulator
MIHGQTRNPDSKGAAQTREPPNAAQEISSLDIVVAVPHDEEGDMLARELSRTRSSVRHIWPLPQRFAEGPDVLVCELTRELPQCLPLPGQPFAALMVVTHAMQPPQFKLLRDCAPHAVLHRPFTSAAVQTALSIARAQFLYERRLRARIDQLDETLRSFRNVERAKSILMQKRNLGEEEAYHFMRRQAMSQRVSMGAIAAAIIDSHSILG